VELIYGSLQLCAPLWAVTLFGHLTANLLLLLACPCSPGFKQWHQSVPKYTSPSETMLAEMTAFVQIQSFWGC